MTETWALSVDCPQCFHQWAPYGNTRFMVPITKMVICPKCNNQFEYTWYDAETKKKLTQKELGLLDENITPEELADLYTEIELLQKELDLEKTKREIFEVRLEQMENWKKEREQSFKDIDLLVQELKDEEEFKKDGR